MVIKDIDLADRFDKSGPKHIMSPAMIDWDNMEHRRCIAACLVKGTYVLESDRTRRRVELLAPAWWEGFQFRRKKTLLDGSSIFGAIYEHVAPRRQPSAPRYVVAFRGTMLPAIRDLLLDGKVVLNILPDSNRCQDGRLAVEDLLDSVGGPDNCVWLAGHSLGASIALGVGRMIMARPKTRLGLPTFLFNPPQVSLAPAIRKLHATEAAKKDLYSASFVVKAGLGLVLSGHQRRMKKTFERLSPWAPELYVHEKDVICNGFVDYFEQRQLVEERFGRVGKLAMMLSYRDLLSSVFGVEKERPHLLPSATLWKTTTDSDAHGLKQWWKPDGELGLSTRRYSYNGA